MSELVTVSFSPSDKQIDILVGTSAMDAAIKAGVQVNAVCAGKGSCGKCHARLLKGSLSEISPVERALFSPQQLHEKFILLCQRKILGDSELEILAPSVPDSYSPVKGDFSDLAFEVDCPISKTFYQLTLPSIADQRADLDRVLSELSSPVTVEISLVNKIPDLLRKADYCVTSVVVNNALIDVEEGDTSLELYGIAFDIGTTSIAGYLVNLLDGRVLASTSATNRQGIHGADVISRITFTRETREGLIRLQKLVVETLDDVVLKLLRQSGVAQDRVYLVTLIGNTVMSHLLLGISPIGVASAPFVPAFTSGLNGSVREFGLKTLPGRTRFVLLPNIAGYVGSDTVGVMLATQMDRLKGTWLAVDIGTNGEIVLASEGRILTCSTAAGPAFEGACISQGMRAELGAIFKVDITEDVCLSVIGEVEPQGICGSGLIDAVAEMVRLGILKTNGRIKSQDECPGHLAEAVKSRIRQTEKGLKFVLSTGLNEVAITQQDISELQLGKGAVRAGIDLLMEELNLKADQLDGILVAGAFGSNLRTESAQGIGMFPELDLRRIKPVGNAAGTGGIIALLSKQQLQLANELSKRVEHLELSLHPGFSRKFAKSISFKVRIKN